jgi:hypothetical protein
MRCLDFEPAEVPMEDALGGGANEDHREIDEPATGITSPSPGKLDHKRQLTDVRR